MPENPQIQNKLSDSKFSTVSKLVAFEAFQKQKRQRKMIEQQRKMIELNVASLYRQAKRASKQLNHTQIALIQHMNRKSTKQQEQRLKQQFKRLKEQQLHQLRNNNSLSRYMNIIKRQQAKKKLIEQNREMSLYIKQRQKHDVKLKKMKEMEENRMIFEKNLALGNNIKSGIQLAKARKFYQKQCLSSAVRNDLLSIQNQRIENQKMAIEQLSQKKKQLKQLFTKAKQQKHKYETILDVGRRKSFVQMYELVVAKEGQRVSKKKKKSHRKRKMLSDSKIISSYLGNEDDVF